MRSRLPVLFRRPVRGLLAALAAAGLAVPVVPAGAVTPDPLLAVRGGITVLGHGFGHGHGMSQYGALGAAQRGLTHRQILAFYYPGTRVASLGGSVRVLITADTDNDLRVFPRTGLRAIDRGTGQALTLPAGPKLWRFSTVSGKVQLSGWSGTRWVPTKVAGRALLVGPGEFRASGPMTLRTPTGDRRYRGGLQYVKGDTVNVLSLEKYLRGVVPAEIPTSWSAAAVRAQAVAARTYAAWSRAQSPATRHYQICDTSSCQVYRGASGETAAGNAAVKATYAQVLTYAGRPAFAQFGSSSGGQTAAGGQPYLPSRSDPYDATAANRVHSWSKPLDPAPIQKAYPALGTLTGVRVLARDGAGQWGGRVTSVLLDGSKADVTVTGARVRSLLGLRSTYFTFSG